MPSKHAAIGALLENRLSVKVLFSYAVFVIVVIVQPSNLSLFYCTFSPSDSDGNTDVSYCFWEVSLASPLGTFFFHKQIIHNH